MEKRVSIRDIAEMHLSQQLERKKALLLNLELDACARQGIPWTPTQGILSLEDRRRYEMNQSIILPNGTFTKQFSLPNYFRGENAYAPTGKNLQKYDVADKYIPGIRKECAGGPEEWLEFTSNFDLALFYACCKWDEEQLEWLPMTEADIERPFGEGEPDPALWCDLYGECGRCKILRYIRKCTGVSYHDTGRKSGRWREPGVYFCNAHER